VTSRVLTRGTVVIDRERCKGCDLCIAACPPDVLVMSEDVNAMGYRFPLLLPGCTGCRACHAVCPDFVFSVFKYVEPVWLPTDGVADDQGDDRAADTADDTAGDTADDREEPA